MNNFHFWDTHAHVLNEYYEDIEDIYNLAIKNNVKYILNSGTDAASNKEVLVYADKYDNMYATLGIHPGSVEKYVESDLIFIENNIKNEKVLAVGEIGLDYYYGAENKLAQKELFEKQLKLAEKYNVPVVVHSREATLDTLEILNKYNVKGVIHSFSGSLETAREYIKLGYMLGINGVVTFKNCKTKDFLKNIPLDNIVLETDCPFLTPVPYRGKVNDSSKIINIADFVANIYNISIYELADITNNNVNKIFNI